MRGKKIFNKMTMKIEMRRPERAIATTGARE